MIKPVHNLIDFQLFFKNRPDFQVKRQLVESILQERGQTLITRLLHECVFSLPSFLLSDVADVIVELTLTSKDVSISSF